MMLVTLMPTARSLHDLWQEFQGRSFSTGLVGEKLQGFSPTLSMVIPSIAITGKRLCGI
jgi:hypothetical protein